MKKQVVETQVLLRQLEARKQIAVNKLKTADAGENLVLFAELDARVHQLNEVIQLVTSLSREV